jgi:hypothetical protein
LAQRNAISAPATGLMIYQTNSTPGFYYYDGSAWKPVSAKGANLSLSNLSNTAVNTNLKPGTNNAFDIGKTDSAWKNLYLSGAIFVAGKQTVRSVGDASDNILLGTGAGTNITTGIENIAIGNSALNQVQTASGNIAIGKGALFINSASGNTSIGTHSMQNNTTGYQNSAFGYEALYSNVPGFNNSAFGYKSLHNNNGVGFDGLFNSAFGSLSLYSNTTGSFNSAFGVSALGSNTSGVSNAAMGNNSLNANTSGDQNTAIGSNSLNGNTTGSWNTALGASALYSNTAQDKNTAVGWSAGDGMQSSASTYLGFNAHASVVVSGSTALGVNAIVTASNQVRIGTNAITSIGGYVNWSNISDGRYKKNIKSNVPGLAFINSLNPVTYTLDIDGIDKRLNPVASKNNTEAAADKAAKETKSKIIYTGFIAQDVEAAAKKIGYDFSGIDAPKNESDLYGLRYSEFVVPLVKAVQELSKQNDEKDKLINELNDKIDLIEGQLNQLIQQGNISSANSNQSNSYSATLEQNIPNPFSESTIIKYKIPASAKTASLNITANNGQLLKTINITAKGSGQINLDARDLSAGTYYYTLIIDGRKTGSNKMIVIK